MCILIIQTAFIGDVILATPLVEKLHALYPDAKIDFLLRKGNESLLANNHKINEILIWDKKRNKYSHLYSLLQQVRSKKYDLVVNLQRFFPTGLLTAFSGAKETAGFDKNPFSFLFTKKVKHEIGEGRHEVDRNISLIRHLTNDSLVKPKLYPSEKDFQKIKPTGNYVCMAPTSVWLTKQWPAQKWVELIQLIDKTISIYLLGGPEDIPACENIKQKSAKENVINIAGQLSFLESAALMKNAEMNYVNDSAPLHLASAVNAPVTAIFCSTIPGFGFTPLSDNSRIIETEIKLDCRPCGLHGFKACPKGHFKCAEIAVEKVV